MKASLIVEANVYYYYPLFAQAAFSIVSSQQYKRAFTTFLKVDYGLCSNYFASGSGSEALAGEIQGRQMTKAMSHTHIRVAVVTSQQPTLLS